MPDEAGLPSSPTLEHLRPTSRLGKSDELNVLAACASCNSVRQHMLGRAFWLIRRDLLENGRWPAGTWAKPSALKAIAAARSEDDVRRRENLRVRRGRTVKDDAGALWRIRRVKFRGPATP